MNCDKKKTLYVSDMDGTLLDNNSRISPVTAAMLSELSRKGALVTVATARTPATVDPLLSATYTCCPAIVMTGAAFWDRKARRMVDAQLFAPGVALDLASRFKAYGLDPFIYTVESPSHLNVYHGVEMNKGELDFYEERRNLELKKFHLGETPGENEFDSTILLFCIGETEPVKALAAELSQRTDCSVSCYPDINSPERSLIELFAPGVNKANAVRRLAKQVGAERVVVFGDNLNDLSMMSVADVAVAVENAFPEVKEKADVVIGRNSDNAVARFIESDFLN